MADKELQLSLSKLSNAIIRLREGVARAHDDLEKDGVIQRFEFTYELTWKTLKIFLMKEGIDCKSPRECFKQAFKMGMITEEKIILGMIEDRNAMSHIYSETLSGEIYVRIKESYVDAIENILSKIQNYV